MTGGYRENARETDAVRLARERERYATFWEEASLVDRRIRVAGLVAVGALLTSVVFAKLVGPAAWLTIGVIAVAARVAHCHQRRLRRLRCPRCGERYFGAIANQAVAKMCVHCRLPRNELQTGFLSGRGEVTSREP